MSAACPIGAALAITLVHRVPTSTWLPFLIFENANAVDTWARFLLVQIVIKAVFTALADHRDTEYYTTRTRISVDQKSANMLIKCKQGSQKTSELMTESVGRRRGAVAKSALARGEEPDGRHPLITLRTFLSSCARSQRHRIVRKAARYVLPRRTAIVQLELSDQPAVNLAADGHVERRPLALCCQPAQVSVHSDSRE